MGRLPMAVREKNDRQFGPVTGAATLSSSFDSRPGIENVIELSDSCGVGSTTGM